MNKYSLFMAVGVFGLYGCSQINNLETKDLNLADEIQIKNNEKKIEAPLTNESIDIDTEDIRIQISNVDASNP